MLKIYALLAFLCLPFLSHAQLRLGITGGPHSATVNETNSLPGWESQIKPRFSKRPGMHLGLIGDVPLTAFRNQRWFLQPGIQYIGKGRKYYMSNDSVSSVLSDTISASSTLAVNYIEIPVNMTYKLPVNKKLKIALSAGPYIGFFYNGKHSFETKLYQQNSYNIQELKLEAGKEPGKVGTIDAGLNGRVGIEIGNLMLSGFLSRGLTNFYTASYPAKFRHRTSGLTIGLWLNQPKHASKQHIPVISIDPAPAQEKPVPDSDGDGVNDLADFCPDQPGRVAFNGCPPPDLSLVGVREPKLRVRPAVVHVQPVTPPVVSRKDVEKQIRFAASHIRFAPGSNILVSSSSSSLLEVANILKENTAYKLVIKGHTDALGNPSINKRLSQRRAEAVKKFLTDRGVAAKRLSAIGYGADKPIAKNTTARGRAINRRVELQLGR